MSKWLLGLLLGAGLGLVDGASAYLYPYPDVRSQIIGIVVGSTFKGLVTGVITGALANRLGSVPAGVAFGLVLGLFFSWLVAWGGTSEGNHYYWEIMLPGSALGAIVGFATQRYGRGRAPVPRPA